MHFAGLHAACMLVILIRRIKSRRSNINKLK
jgi:hypothetical protein